MGGDYPWSIDTLDDLIAEADFILHIKPQNIITENKYVKVVGANKIMQYKGDRSYEQPYFLPASIELGSEYIVCFFIRCLME